MLVLWDHGILFQHGCTPGAVQIVCVGQHVRSAVSNKKMQVYILLFQAVHHHPCGLIKLFLVEKIPNSPSFGKLPEVLCVQCILRDVASVGWKTNYLWFCREVPGESYGLRGDKLRCLKPLKEAATRPFRLRSSVG